ncbi:ABC transporter substrate-binding protein [Paracoccus caeni]|uniref:ABC transporter substrate-binding protein n=1 Tax=Paracoccus caeni TaxID=657651 RepID=A0A934SN74_9RHOB|nr:ABC transporter substrate-binding protein [Paracoccus caeni]MBK4218194.1 ABC transporter substrate-binding protein [Paracoccus caeni]
MKQAAILTALLASLALPAFADPFRLIVSDAETPLVPNSVMELALQEGYFDRAGVEVEFVRVGQSPMVMAALRSGEGEMANVALETLLQAVASGAQDLRGVMSPNKALPYLIAGRNVGAVTDLTGKRFGIGRVGSVDHLLSLRVLEAAGVDPASLQMVALGQPQARAQAMLAGQIDATTMGIGSFTAIDQDPAVSILIDMGDFYEAAPVLSKLNVVTTETLATRGPEVQAVIEALILAARDFQANPEHWIEAMQKARPDVPPEDLRFLADAFAGSWMVNGGLDLDELTRSQAWLHEGEDFSGLTIAPPEAYADPAPLSAVLDRIGISAAGDAP